MHPAYFFNAVTLRLRLVTSYRGRSPLSVASSPALGLVLSSSLSQSRLVHLGTGPLSLSRSVLAPSYSFFACTLTLSQPTAATVPTACLRKCPYSAFLNLVRPPAKRQSTGWISVLLLRTRLDGVNNTRAFSHSPCSLCQRKSLAVCSRATIVRQLQRVCLDAGA